jgi:uncharacterized membrane-anchored protein YitT (DUF2179 family)
MQKPNLSTKNVLISIKKYFFICLGLAVFAFGWTAFLIPNNLMGGGISGIATLIYFALKIPIGISTLVLNLILIAIALKILGPRFGTSTVVCTLLLSLFFSILQPLFPKPLVNDMFLCALIGAMLSGAGVGIALNYGGNTGGTDIIILIITKFRNISYGRLSLFINVLIIASSYLIVRSIESLVYSYVAMIAYTFTSDMVIDGYKQTFQFMVFSVKNREIANRINNELHRGATLIKGYGSYTKEDIEILLVIAHRADKANITRIIKEVDNRAFISIAKTSGVFGKNFDTLRL